MIFATDLLNTGGKSVWPDDLTVGIAACMIYADMVKRYNKDRPYPLRDTADPFVLRHPGEGGCFKLVTAMADTIVAVLNYTTSI